MKVLLLLIPTIASAQFFPFPGPGRAPVNTGAPIAVLTAAYSNARLGWQPSEPNLTPTNVASGYGINCTYVPPDGGSFFAQPVIVPNVGGHHLLIDGTMGSTSSSIGGNNLYAFDESSPTCSSTPIWTANFGTPASGYGGFNGTNVGILSTPVVDVTNGWVWCISYTAGTPTLVRLNKVNLTTGAIISQTTISGSTTFTPGVGCVTGMTLPTCSGDTESTSGGNLLFQPAHQNQRDSLLLLGGNVYVSFSGNSNHEPGVWHGWVLKFDEATATLQKVISPTSGNGIATGANGGGIWPPGTGMSSDGTSIYVPAGNGTFDLSTGGPDWGMTVAKLDANLAIQDYATASNWATLSNTDLDVMCNPMLIDSTHLACADKSGCGWVLNTSSMGHVNAIASSCTAGGGNTQQVYQVSSTQVFGGAYCLGALYYPAVNGVLQAFSYSAGTVNPTPFASSSGSWWWSPVTCTSSGGTNGIIWASTSIRVGVAFEPIILMALKASDLSLINSWTGFGNFTKWAEPVDDGIGHIFVASDAGLTKFGFGGLMLSTLTNSQLLSMNNSQLLSLSN